MKSEWQPIETAPKGRTAVLGFWLGKPVNGRNYAIMRRTRTGWVSYAEPLNLDYDVTPSHWMKLPDPPKESK